jgi:2-amino-4-hydroxy-6-hydroxymethyldihydropteridine diphosphokinase
VTRAYVGLGSNVGDREAAIRSALDLLGECVEVLAVSSIRETEPWGVVDQPRFLNAAAAVETELGARDLVDVLLDVERELGRTRAGARWGPRTIDLDLLVYDDLVLDEPGVTVPHPRLHERTFALEPLVELDSGLTVPGRGPVAELLARLQSGA